MEESKELQGFYKIFRAVIYVSILMEFFAYALEPEQLDFLGGVVTDIHTRIKRWYRTYSASGQHGSRTGFLRYDRYSWPYAFRCTVRRFFFRSGSR